MSFTFDPNRSDEDVAALQKETTEKGPISAWSFSALTETYEKCKYRLYLTRVKKLKGPENDAANRGSMIHDLAENYIKGEIGELPSELAKFKDLFEKLHEEYSSSVMYVEEEWGFTDKWKPTGYFAKDTWLRVKLDAMVMHDDQSATLYDWKTGRKFGNEIKHLSQAQLYAISAFKRFPTLEYVEVKFIYLDHAEILEKSYTMKNIQAFIPRWEERAFKMITEKDFDPNPNKHNCLWCPHQQSGNCEWAITTPL